MVCRSRNVTIVPLAFEPLLTSQGASPAFDYGRTRGKGFHLEDILRRVQEAAVQRQRSLCLMRERLSDADASMDSRHVNRLDSHRGRDSALYDLQP